MKTLLLLIAFAVTAAQATPIPQFKNKKMTAVELRSFLTEMKSVKPPHTFARHGGPQASVIVPIREGRFKAEIIKFEVIEQPDNTYLLNATQVCIVEGKAPVYDVRGLTSVIWPATLWSTCASTVGGQPATVKVGADMIFNTRPLFSDEAEGDVKVAFSQIMVEVAGLLNQSTSGFALTRDLSAKSIFGWLGVEFPQVCIDDGHGGSVCNTLQGEYFVGSIESLD